MPLADFVRSFQHTVMSFYQSSTMRHRRDKRAGQSLVEYGLVLALVGIAAILVVKAVGRKATSTFDNIQSQMTTQGIASVAPMSASS